MRVSPCVHLEYCKELQEVMSWLLTWIKGRSVASSDQNEGSRNRVDLELQSDSKAAVQLNPSQLLQPQKFDVPLTAQKTR